MHQLQIPKSADKNSDFSCIFVKENVNVCSFQKTFCISSSTSDFVPMIVLESCDQILSFISIIQVLKLLSPRCILWCCVHWDGWSCFTDGKCLAGKPLQHHALSLLQPFIALQHHHVLSINNYKPLHGFLFSGSSLHIWHDQWASSWSVPIRHAVPHTKLNSRYFLSGTFTCMTAPHYTKKTLQMSHIEEVADRSLLCREALWE